MTREEVGLMTPIAQAHVGRVGAFLARAEGAEIRRSANNDIWV